MGIKLLIFIVTYNSSFRLNLILKKIKKIKKINYKILISDDCSTDDTSTYIPKKNKRAFRVDRRVARNGNHAPKPS